MLKMRKDTQNTKMMLMMIIGLISCKKNGRPDFDAGKFNVCPEIVSADNDVEIIDGRDVTKDEV